MTKQLFSRILSISVMGLVFCVALLFSIKRMEGLVYIYDLGLTTSKEMAGIECMIIIATYVVLIILALVAVVNAGKEAQSAGKAFWQGAGFWIPIVNILLALVLIGFVILAVNSLISVFDPENINSYLRIEQSATNVGSLYGFIYVFLIVNVIQLAVAILGKTGKLQEIRFKPPEGSVSIVDSVSDKVAATKDKVSTTKERVATTTKDKVASVKAPQPTMGAADIAEELKQFKALQDAGLITEEDYEKKKEQLLQSPAGLGSAIKKPERYCPYCGKKVPVGAKFCGKCGKELQ